MTGETVLEIEDLRVSYNGVPAVDGVSIAVRRSEITCIVGSNGAGKTTLMKTVAGILAPAGGRIRFRGEEIAGRPPDEIVRRGLTLVPEGRRLFPTMSVRDNLRTGAFARADDKAVRADFEKVLAYFPILGERLSEPARSLSGGQQQMLAVGRALMAAPMLLMLDEPTIGLAPTVVETIADIIRTVSDDGVDILLVEQNAHMALEISERAYVLENGTVTLSGRGDELLRSDRVREAYLGL